VTTAFDDRRELTPSRHIHGRLRRIGRWLADQWPKLVIAFAFALTLVWTAVLAWLVTRVAGLV
jgi:hypothetical protein